MTILSNNIRTQFFMLLLFLCSFFKVQAQVYTLKSGLDFGLLGGGAVALIAGQAIQNETMPLSLEEINQLDPSQVNSFDRPAVYNNSENARMASDVLVFVSIAAPISLMADKKVRESWAVTGVMGLEVLMLTTGITNSVKGLSLRTRPYAYNPAVSDELKQEKDARYSFFSGHTSVSAAATFFAAKVFSDNNPDSKWKPVVWIGASLIPIATAWTRVESGRHFNTDVIAGYVLGAGIGYLIPILHLSKSEKETPIDLKIGVQGFRCTYTF